MQPFRNKSIFFTDDPPGQLLRSWGKRLFFSKTLTRALFSLLLSSASRRTSGDRHGRRRLFHCVRASLQLVSLRLFLISLYSDDMSSPIAQDVLENGFLLFSGNFLVQCKQAACFWFLFSSLCSPAVFLQALHTSDWSTEDRTSCRCRLGSLKIGKKLPEAFFFLVLI